MQNSQRADPEKRSGAPKETYLLGLPWDPQGDARGVNQVVKSLYDGISRDGQLRS